MLLIINFTGFSLARRISKWIDHKRSKNKIPLIKNDNVQKEFYLTDIFNFIENNRISTYKTNDSEEISGINTIEQLKILENKLNK